MKSLFRLELSFVGLVTILPAFFGNFALSSDPASGKIKSSKQD